jgi:hypothetical protein
LGRYLTKGDIKQLSQVSQTSKETAIEMYESYRRNPAQFVLDMYKALGHVYLTLFGTDPDASAKRFDLLISVVSQILNDSSKLLAEETRRIRAIKVPFYIITGILILALIIGLLFLTGINSTNALLNLNQDVIMWRVGIPVGLSIYGVLLCLSYIRIVVS